jgi:hypothetical protein
VSGALARISRGPFRPLPRSRLACVRRGEKPSLDRKHDPRSYAVYQRHHESRGSDAVLLHVAPYGPSIIDVMPFYLVLESESSCDSRRRKWSNSLSAAIGVGAPPSAVGVGGGELMRGPDVLEGYCYQGAFFSPHHFAEMKEMYDKQLLAYEAGCRKLPRAARLHREVCVPRDLPALKKLLDAGKRDRKRNKNKREVRRMGGMLRAPSWVFRPSLDIAIVRPKPPNAHPVVIRPAILPLRGSRAVRRAPEGSGGRRQGHPRPDEEGRKRATARRVRRRRAAPPRAQGRHLVLRGSGLLGEVLHGRTRPGGVGAGRLPGRDASVQQAADDRAEARLSRFCSPFGRSFFSGSGRLSFAPPSKCIPNRYTPRRVVRDLSLPFRRAMSWMDRFEVPGSSSSSSRSVVEFVPSGADGARDDDARIALVWDRGPAGDFVYGGLNDLPATEKRKRYEEFIAFDERVGVFSSRT